VPGDIIKIEEDMIIPCDCILIKGEVVVNEAILTGESMPITKENIKASESKFTV